MKIVFFKNKMPFRIHHIPLLVLLLVESSNQTQNFIKCPKRCSCNKIIKGVKCVNANMTSIPQLPAYTKNLMLRGNKLNNLTSSTFRNIVNLPLEVLRLPQNDIRSISKDAFSGFKLLRILELSKNLIHVQDLIHALSNIKSNLTKIYLNDLTLNDTSIHLVFSALSKFKLSTLQITKNTFTFLNFTVLNSTLPWLEQLNAGYGSVIFIQSWYMRHLKVLKLCNNNINLTPYAFWNNPDCYFPNLETLRLDSNNMNDFRFRFNCLSKLKTLGLNYNPVTIISNDTFSYLPSLELLTLCKLGSRIYEIEAHAFRNNKLRVLDISGNSLEFTEDSSYFRYDKDLIFKGLPNLLNLTMGGNHFKLDILTSMVLPLQRLHSLNLCFSFLGFMPTGLIYKLPNLRELDVSKNSIIDWDGNKVFSNGSIALTHLNLSFNAIKAINKSQFPTKTIDGLLQLDLSHNPFSCSCRNLWFTKWFNQNQSLFNGHPANYICKEPRIWSNKNFSSYRPTDIECLYDYTLFKIIVMSLSAIGIVLTCVVSLVYKKHWHIMYWIYLHFKRKEYTRILEEKEEYKYDAFVVYSDGDRGWVYSELCEQVEKKHGIKFCIHHRDFEGGKLIIDNIVDHMADSRRIVIVTSKNMIKSEWCLFETRVAQEKFLNREQGAIVIILLDNLPKSEMPSALKFLVNYTTYFQWPEQDAEEQSFWQDFVKSLKPPTICSD